MRIYIANLGKYNEGELVGAWFTPPVDYDEMAERIGLNDRYVRGMPVVKAFNQTASSFARLEHAIKEYTEWVLKFSLGWQNYMPAFTTIINNIYLVIVPVGILLGANAQDYKSFTMTFIFYLLFVPAIAGILNKIMYISESFMQIDGNVARMDEIFNIPVLPQTTSPKKTQKDMVALGNWSCFCCFGVFSSKK